MLNFSSSVIVVEGAAAALGIKDKVSEVLLLGVDIEVVVSNAVPLVVEADKTNYEEDRQTYSKTGKANYL